MRFMMVMIPKVYQPGAETVTPGTEIFEAMARYNDELKKAGVLLALDGLRPPSEGRRIKVSGGKHVVTDAPFAEAKEVIGGYWMIQVKSKEEAYQWASRIPGMDGDVIEVRQVQELSDFPPEVQKIVRE